MRLRRFMTVMTATIAALMLFAGTAFAHFCYVPNRSDQGNTGAARSQTWLSIDQILAEEGLCEEGAAYFEEAYLSPRGASLSTLIHTRALLAAPHFGTAKMSDGRGIDHLFGSEEDFIELDQIFEEAFAIC
jgi:hypothetical protein